MRPGLWILRCSSAVKNIFTYVMIILVFLPVVLQDLMQGGKRCFVENF